MRIIHNNNPGFHYGNRFKLGENPVSTVISGMFGLGETEMTNDTNALIAAEQIRLQQEENQKNRDYNTLEAEKARQHEINMIRDTPSLQVQGMHEAGINPQVALSNSTQVATGGSSGNQQASYSGGLSPVPYQAQNPASAFAQVAQGLSSLASAKEKGANVGLIEKQVENMAIDSQMKRALTDGYKLSNELQKLDLKYRDKKLLQDIQEQVLRMATTTAQGKLFTEQANIQRSVEQLNRSLANYHGQNADYLKLKIANYTVELNSVLKLNAAQTKKANKEAYESGVRAVGLEFDNAIKKVDSENAAKLAQDKLQALKAQYMTDTSKSATQRKQFEVECTKLNKVLEMYRQHPNKAALDAALDNFNEHFPILGGFIKALKP